MGGSASGPGAALRRRRAILQRKNRRKQPCISEWIRHSCESAAALFFPVFIFAFDFSFFGEKFFFTQNPKDPPARPGRTERENTMILQNLTGTNGEKFDLCVRDGKIFSKGLQLEAGPGEETLDCRGLTALPGFVDTHCHWRTPGFEYKEDITTGSQAAAAGGYTFVNLMPNTNPVCSSVAIANSVMQEAERVGLCGCNQTLSITKDFDGETLDHLKTLPATVRFVTEDGKGVQNNQTMARAFAICQQKGITIMSHAEDMQISKWDYRLAENIETVRNLHLAEYYGTRLHFCHVSTKEAIEAIEASRWKGAPVTCEVTPHHLWWTKDVCDYRVNPPIREQADVDALVEAIRLGAVDTIGTDHAPHTAEEKQNGAAGMVGLETAFAICYTKLCLQCGLPLQQLAELMSTNGAAILGLQNKGKLEIGYDADIALVDLAEQWTVHNEALHSKSKNSPYEGVQLTGKVKYTFHNGRMTWKDQ